MRRSRKKRKAKYLYLFLVLLIPFIGISYSIFSEQLNISGTANSAPLNINPIDPIVNDPVTGEIIITDPPNNFGDPVTIVEDDELTIIYQQQEVVTGYPYSWETLEFNVVNNTDFIWTNGRIFVDEETNSQYLDSVSQWVVNPWLPPGGIGGIGLVYRLNSSSFTEPISVRYRLRYKIDGSFEWFYFTLRILPLL